jgi:aspartate aminotransferase, cytoplasmic
VLLLAGVMEVDSRFSRLEILPPDLGLEKLPIEYNADEHPQKVSLGAGVYRSEDGEHWILPAVNKVITLRDF